MTKPPLFRETLGLTQEEAAIILKIPVSQLAMFEIGQRDLPIAAHVKLVELYKHVQNKQQEKVSPLSLHVDTLKMTQIIEKELQANRHQQLALQRKINDLEKRYTKNVATLHLVDYIQTQIPEPTQNEKEMAELLCRKALKAIEKNGPAVQLKWKLKRSALQAHQQELHQELKTKK